MSETTLDSANARDALRELGNALDRLDDALARDVSQDSLVLDATIQRFEFCVELTWKTLKKLLEAEGEDATTPKQTLQKAYVSKWIDDEAQWLAMLKDRNLSSHTYKQKLAQEVYGRVGGHARAMRALYVFLIKRYGAPV